MLRIQTEDFEIGAELASMTRGRTEIGAIVTFSGIVRDDDGLQDITLEHYPGMTEAEIGRIEHEARMRWALEDCLIVHRIGMLRPGDNIVLVVTAAAHRGDAFAAAEFLMDYLKTRAPFWKREGRTAGASWVEARESDDHAAQRWSDKA